MTTPAGGGNLARRQAELAAFLTGAGPLPAGFDPRAGRTAARSLDRKRSREMASCFPEMAAALGGDYTPLSLAWLPGRPRLGPDEQATSFALDHADRLPESVLRRLAVRVALRDGLRGVARVRLGARTAVVLGTARRVRGVHLR